LAQKQSESSLPDAISVLLQGLSVRERRIVEARFLSGEEALTLSDLAKELGVSVERVRQIETAALKHMRAARPDLVGFLSD
jgi:RNA polymerase sigma-32 factor